MDHHEEIGPAQLKRWRGGASQAVAAERLSVNQSLYSEWETGKKTPGILNLGWIRKITGISLEAWLPEDLRLVAPPALASTKPRRSRPSRPVRAAA